MTLSLVLRTESLASLKLRRS